MFNKKTLYLLSVFIILLIFLFPVYSSAKTNNEQMLSVKSCGAVGDGIHDDSDSILDALSRSKVVFFPAGTYYITKQIVIPNGCTITGTSNTILDFHGNTTSGYDYGYLVNENSSWLNSEDLAHDISIKNITIKKSDVLTTEKAILLLSNVTNVTIDNVTFQTTYNDRVNTIDMLVNCHDVTVTNSSFYHNQGYQSGGLWIRDRYNKGVSYGTSNITFDNCYFEKNSGLDEIIAIFSCPNTENIFGSVSNVTISNSQILCNYNSTDHSNKSNATHLLTTSIGDTENIVYENCKIINNNPIFSTFKMTVHSNSVINPMIISGCTIKCLKSFCSSHDSCMLYTEGDTQNQETARIVDSNLYVGKHVICCNKDINFENSNFYISDNGVALDSNNIARNCHFYISNCNEASRIIRNGKSILIDSTITFENSDASRYVIQPSELTNTDIDSPVPVLIQYGYGA